MTRTIKEMWTAIPEFPNYQISNFGRVYNLRFGMVMSTNPNNYGHLKINLIDEFTGKQSTRSVRFLVAEAFVPKPNHRCKFVIVLDGDQENMSVDNLAWRPYAFAYRYARQMRIDQPRHYENLPVLNLSDGILYSSIVQAGMTEGLLFDDIWNSTYTKDPVFPTGSVFEVHVEE